MPAVAIRGLADQILHIAGATARGRRTDRELLEEFVKQHEQAAFTTLVRRHGPMVFGVCERILRHRQDAEDVFQATFLILAQKARSVHWHESIANWLYGVAHRLALKQRSVKCRRREITALEYAPDNGHSPAGSGCDVQAILDQELEQLPAKYRAPLVLCYLEGKSRSDAAHQLGWSMQSIKGHLERGRILLRKRLQKRGLALSVAMVGTTLAQSTASAALPNRLVQSTIEAGLLASVSDSFQGVVSEPVRFLTEEVFSTMFWTKGKLAISALILTVAVTASVGLVPAQFVARQQREGAAFAGDRGEGREGEGRPQRGIFKSADLKKGTITITTQRDGEQKRDVTFNLAGKDVVVATNLERKAALKDLTPGLRVVLYVTETNDVQRIRAEVPVLRLRIQAVHPDKRSITIHRGEGGGQRALAVAKDALITIKGRRSDLGKIESGATAVAMLSLDKTQIVLLRVGGDREGDRPRDGDREARRNITAQLQVVNENKRLVSILIRRDAGDEKKTLKLGKEVGIFLEGERRGKLGDLRVGTMYQFQTADDGKTVTRILPFRRGGRRIQARGTVKSIDVKKGTLVLSVPRENGSTTETTYKISPEARFAIGGREGGKLADVKAGTRVTLRLTPDRRTVIGIQTVRGDGERDR